MLQEAAILLHFVRRLHLGDRIENFVQKAGWPWLTVWTHNLLYINESLEHCNDPLLAWKSPAAVHTSKHTKLF